MGLAAAELKTRLPHIGYLLIPAFQRDAVLQDCVFREIVPYMELVRTCRRDESVTAEGVSTKHL